MAKRKSWDRYDSLSPADYRYHEEDVAAHLSENGFTRYKLAVETALVKVFARRGICRETVVREVERASQKITTDEVYAEERRIGHDIRALVNCICARIRPWARPFVHRTATSYDIIDSANAARYKQVTTTVVLPALRKLEGTLIALTLRYADTAQIGRTHGQHAVPITFGFAIAWYIDRLGNCVLHLEQLADELVGKFSGAVGAYNASSFFFDDPQNFEAEVLAEIGLRPAAISTQIAPPEPLARLLCEYTLVAGVLANLGDDMRHLQRSEIGEVGEEFQVSQVGSSTMPQKRNPINFENVKSLWKIVAPRILTVFLDQISEHQRDLTGSASGRTYGEVVNYVVSMTRRLNRTLSKLSVDEGNLQRNLRMTGGLIGAEPLYLLLASLGYPDAHEKVRLLTLEAQGRQRPLGEIIWGDMELRSYLERMTDAQGNAVDNPVAYYRGIAGQKARQIAETWQNRLSL